MLRRLFHYRIWLPFMVSCHWCTCFTNVALMGQPPHSRQFLMQDGLPENNGYIFHLLQDHKGFLWGSSENGMFRYDGHTFEEIGRESGILDRMTLRTIEDPHHHLWVQTFSGEFARYDGRSFVPYRYNDLVAPMACFDRCWHFQVDRRGAMYLGTSDKGLWKIDPQGNVAHLVAPAGENVLYYWIPDSLPPIAFGCVDSKEGPNIRMTRMCLLDQDLQTTLDITLDDPAIRRETRPFFARRSDGTHLLLFGSGLYWLTGTKLLAFRQHGSLLNGVMEDVRGNVWIARGDGLAFIAHGQPADSKPTIYFRGTSFHSLLEDREGGLWFGTRDEGLFHAPFSSIKKHTTGSGLIPEDNLEFIACSPQSAFVSTATRNILQITKDTCLIHSLGDKLEPATERAITAMYWDAPRDRLLVAFGSRLVSLYESGTFEEIQLPDGDLIYRILGFYPSPDSSAVWVAEYSGLLKLESDKITRIFSKAKDRVRGFAEAPDGRLWVAGEKGLWQVHGSKMVHDPRTYPVLNSRVYDMLYHKDRLWVASVNFGLGILEGDSLSHIPAAENGFRDVHNLVGEKDTVWALGKKYLLKFVICPGDSMRIEKWPVNLDKGCSIFSMALVKDKFLITSSNGLIEVARKTLNAVQIPPPPIRLTRITINNRDTALLASFDLGPDENYIQVDFSGISFNENLVYRYRMLGIDEQWQFTSDRSVSYKKMAPGDYTFEVYAQGLGNTLSAAPAKFTLHIRPPLRDTWWFRTLAAILVLGAGGAIFQWRFRALRAKQDIEQKLAHLESSALRAQINPHFIFNVLGAIQGYVSEGDSRSSETYLGKFARLIRLILENSRRSYVQLALEVETLEHYLELEQMRFRGRFEYSIAVDPSLPAKTLFIPPMLIQPYLENAIVHGLAGKEENGRVQLFFTPAGHHLLRCEVIDNGTGIRETRAGENNDHQPLGMLITRERLRLLNQRTAQHTEVEITDLAKETPGRSGTRIILLIPFINKTSLANQATNEDSYHRRRRGTENIPA